MDRRLALFALTAVFLACKRSEPAQTQAPADTAMTVADSFRTPESVLYDAALDAYLVSNINGPPFDKDDNGFISRVGTDGRVVELRWIDGASDTVVLHAPKGMAIKGDTLFVADIDELRMFDRVNGRALGSLRVAGATFLNDVTVGPDGTVYVTDTGLDRQFQAGIGAVYRIERGRAVTIARGRLNGPNGVVADTSGILVNFWNGDVARFAATGQRTELPRIAAGGLDGFVRLDDGTLLVSAWNDSSIHRLATGDTAWSRWAGGIVSPADIGFDTRRRRVLIPVFQSDRVEIRPLP